MPRKREQFGRIRTRSAGSGIKNFAPEAIALPSAGPPKRRSAMILLSAFQILQGSRYALCVFLRNGTFMIIIL
jgi:hypothetical protein